MSQPASGHGEPRDRHESPSSPNQTMPPGGLIMEKRIRELFEQLDTDKDGTIDADELRAGLERQGHAAFPGTVQVSRGFLHKEKLREIESG